MPASWIYLFSSDQSYLYVQDILNVLAAPPGHPYTFRYDSRYLTDDLREEWELLQDLPVLIVFSLQQTARLQPAAFIPIRTGYVLSTTREGDSYFITFRLADYAALPEDGTGDSVRQPQSAVAAFSSELRRNTTVPYEASASKGARPDCIDQSADASALFQRTTRYLALADAFSQAYFIRVLGLRRTAADEPFIRPPSANYVYSLLPGEIYDLEFFQTQQHTPEAPVSFTVSADGELLRPLGRPSFLVASRYDRGQVRLVTASLPGIEDRITQLVVAPEAGAQGPTLDFPIRVQSQRGKAVGLAALQSIALIAVALAGSFSSWAIGTRLALAIGGAIAASALGLLGATTLRLPPLPALTR